ncbi:hypothetical protein [Fodinicola feengrottensis]|uniref:hypothetical protein n=1 Tax=Fodinicola feengrottensis TaxID=435914 RepID=UPI002442E13B|nr:hypothetical protein [Fodinicola feengrottensis]
MISSWLITAPRFRPDRSNRIGMLSNSERRYSRRMNACARTSATEVLSTSNLTPTLMSLRVADSARTLSRSLVRSPSTLTVTVSVKARTWSRSRVRSPPTLTVRSRMPATARRAWSASLDVSKLSPMNASAIVLLT